MSQGEPPPRVLLIEEAVEGVTLQFPELWRLGQAYFSGELQAKVLGGQHARFKVIFLIKSQILVQIRNLKCIDIFQDMVLEGITSTCLLMRAALIPTPVPAPRSGGTHSPAKTTTNPTAELGPWLPHCVAQVVALHRSLGSLDLPNEALSLVVNLIQELRCV